MATVRRRRAALRRQTTGESSTLGPSVAEGGLSMRINVLPQGDRVVHLVRSIDRNSSAWVATLPIGYGACTIGEWVEITARFFGVPSPICVGLAARGARLFNRDID
ncbi:hypothetical protein T492DRAFT_879603, partial [Pavlovales sp. CCMP2436]